MLINLINGFIYLYIYLLLLLLLLFFCFSFCSQVFSSLQRLATSLN